MDVDAPNHHPAAIVLSDDEDDVASPTPIKTTKDAEPPKLKLLELPVEVLANIAIHMGKRELVTFGSLCKQARDVASRYLFACISLGKLDSTKMQTCFETLNQDQLSLIRRFNVSLQLPLLPTDRAEERIRTKWLTVLLDLIGRNLKNLDIHVNLACSTPGVDTLSPSLESLSLLAKAAESYSLVLDFAKWKEAGRSTNRFWPIFTCTVLSSLSTKDIQTLKLVQFDSHFGKRNALGQHQTHDDLDFTSPSDIERNLINKLGTMNNLTSLHLKACTFSTHFYTPYPFKLVRLELDFEGSRECQHNANHNVALSLVRANRETLQELYITSWSLTENDTAGVLELPSLRILGAAFINSAPCVDLPTKVLHPPNLTGLFIKRACSHEDLYATLTSTIVCLPKLKYLEIENCNLYHVDPEIIAQTLTKWAAQDIVLKLVWPRDTTEALDPYYDPCDDFYQLEPLQKSVQKVAFRLASVCTQEGVPFYQMPILQYLRLSFTFTATSVTLKGVDVYGLPSDHLVTFFENLEAPVLEILEINFSSPFIDYIQTFARFIGSGGFSTKFQMCREIKGSITADAQNTWDHIVHYGHQKTVTK